jgi:hypothetical protein
LRQPAAGAARAAAAGRQQLLGGEGGRSNARCGRCSRKRLLDGRRVGRLLRRAQLLHYLRLLRVLQQQRSVLLREHVAGGAAVVGGLQLRQRHCLLGKLPLHSLLQRHKLGDCHLPNHAFIVC